MALWLYRSTHKHFCLVEGALTWFGYSNIMASTQLLYKVYTSLSNFQFLWDMSTASFDKFEDMMSRTVSNVPLNEVCIVLIPIKCMSPNSLHITYDIYYQLHSLIRLTNHDKTPNNGINVIWSIALYVLVPIDINTYECNNMIILKHQTSWYLRRECHWCSLSIDLIPSQRHLSQSLISQMNRSIGLATTSDGTIDKSHFRRQDYMIHGAFIPWIYASAQQHGAMCIWDMWVKTKKIYRPYWGHQT